MFGQKHGISDSNEFVLSQFSVKYNYFFFFFIVWLIEKATLNLYID